MLDEKLEKLLDIIIDLYLERGEPIGSKILYKLQILNMAPSTLRKYMHILEKNKYVYRPHSWAWRKPTVKWISYYIDKILKNTNWYKLPIEDINIARDNLRRLVELIWGIVDWVVVWFLREDEYYYLWIQNLLKREDFEEYKVIQMIVDYIENKKIIDFLSKQRIQKGKIHYTFIRNKNDWNDLIISVLYWLLDVNWYKSIISLLSPFRANYKKNISVMKKVLMNSFSR